MYKRQLLLRPGAPRHKPNCPSALPTIFGWVLIGPPISNKSTIHAGITNVDLDASLKRFWEIEEMPKKTFVSHENLLTEQNFIKNVTRLPGGRYSVSLPFNSENPTLGTSIDQADRRLLSLERRFARDDTFRNLYNQFMKDYLDAGHMVLCETDKISTPNYYIPHHGVFKSDEINKKNQSSI